MTLPAPAPAATCTTTTTTHNHPQPPPKQQCRCRSLTEHDGALAEDVVIGENIRVHQDQRELLRQDYPGAIGAVE